MGALGLSIGSALSYGASSFFDVIGGSKRPALQMTMLTFAAALIVAVPSAVVGMPEFSAAAIWSGVVAGVLGTISTCLMYAAFALAPVGFVAPVASFVTVAVPLCWTLAMGQRVSPTLFAAVGIAIIASAALGVDQQGSTRPTVKGIVVTILAGLGDAAWLITLSLSPAKSGGIPAAADAITGFVVIVAVAAAFGRARGSGRRIGDGGIVLASGLTQGAGTVLLVFALHSHELATVAGLFSLYPAVTLLLSVLLRRERFTAEGGFGVSLAAAALGLFAVVNA